LSCAASVEELRPLFRDRPGFCFRQLEDCNVPFMRGQAGNSVLVEAEKSAGLRPWTDWLTLICSIAHPERDG
jgi:hypothetical protein